VSLQSRSTGFFVYVQKTHGWDWVVGGAGELDKEGKKGKQGGPVFHTDGKSKEGDLFNAITNCVCVSTPRAFIFCSKLPRSA